MPADDPADVLLAPADIEPLAVPAVPDVEPDPLVVPLVPDVLPVAVPLVPPDVVPDVVPLVLPDAVSDVEPLVEPDAPAPIEAVSPLDLIALTRRKSSLSCGDAWTHPVSVTVCPVALELRMSDEPALEVPV
jgi:hypothetical protein